MSATCPLQNRTKNWANLNGRNDITGILAYIYIVIVNSYFHTRNNISENYPKFGHVPSESFPSPVQGGRILKLIDLKGAKLPTCLGRPQVSDRPCLGRPQVSGRPCLGHPQVSGRPCLSHFIFLHLIRLMTFGAGHKLVSSSPCNFLVRPTRVPCFFAVR
jgi:hypothetical protein